MVINDASSPIYCGAFRLLQDSIRLLKNLRFTWSQNLITILIIFVTTGCSPYIEIGQPLTVPLENTTIEMAWIPSGTFKMGSPTSEPHRNSDEIEHQVTLTNGFWMGKTEITVRQWQAVMGLGLRGQVTRLLFNDTLYDFGNERQTVRAFMNMNKNAAPNTYLANEGLDLPMHYVSWYDAMRYCRQLTSREQAANRLPEGYVYTLPSEVQWEYACRAGSTTATYGGGIVQDSLGNAKGLAEIAWYSGSSADGYTGKQLGESNAGPRLVGLKQPNIWGLYDMSGNLWEWCDDTYGSYSSEEVLDPIGLDKGINKVNRGGSWGSWANSERSATRAQNPPAEASAYRGFRIVLRRY